MLFKINMVHDRVLMPTLVTVPEFLFLESEFEIILIIRKPKVHGFKINCTAEQNERFPPEKGPNPMG